MNNLSSSNPKLHCFFVLDVMTPELSGLLDIIPKPERVRNFESVDFVWNGPFMFINHRLCFVSFNFF